MSLRYVAVADKEIVAESTSESSIIDAVIKADYEVDEVEIYAIMGKFNIKRDTPQYSLTRIE